MRDNYQINAAYELIIEPCALPNWLWLLLLSSHRCHRSWWCPSIIIFYGSSVAEYISQTITESVHIWVSTPPSIAVLNVGKQTAHREYPDGYLFFLLEIRLWSGRQISSRCNITKFKIPTTYALINGCSLECQYSKKLNFTGSKAAPSNVDTLLVEFWWLSGMTAQNSMSRRVNITARNPWNIPTANTTHAHTSFTVSDGSTNASNTFIQTLVRAIWIVKTSLPCTKYRLGL